MITIWQISLLLGDILTLVISLVTTYSLRSYIISEQFLFSQLVTPFCAVFTIWIVLFFIFNLYEVDSINPNPRNIGRLALAVLINGILGIIFFYIFPNFGLAPKISLLLIIGISFILLVIWRRLFYTIGKSVFMQSIILIGSSKLGEQFVNEITGHPYIKNIHRVPITDSILTTIENTIANTTRSLIIVDNQILIEKVLPFSISHKSKVMTIEEAYEYFLAKIPTDNLSREYTVKIATKKEVSASRLFHLFFDKGIALLVLIIMSPLLLLASIAILIEDGKPVLYSQTRVGKHDVNFTCYKLRSMIQNAETTGALWAGQNDTRVTKVGAIIRKLHIDEIPQMWNILRGDLALVGPRPERPEFVEKLKKEIPHYELRQTVKPGFTGWAQIKFRYARTVDDSRTKFEYDLYYIKNKNLLLDFGIILKTIQIIVTHI